jgi:hypothetical protein
MKIIKLDRDVTAGNDCGGFRPPRGHLDTQMFPECERFETNRDAVKKTVKRRTQNKKKASIELEAKHAFPIVQTKPTQPKGIWEQWLAGSMQDRKFVELMIHLSQQGLPGVSRDPSVRKGIANAIDAYRRNNDVGEAARSIGAFLSMGKSVREELFANASNWYKKAQVTFPEAKSEKEWLHPPLREKIVREFRKNFPNISATLEEMWNWYRKNFTMPPGKKYDWEAHKERDKERAMSDLKERTKGNEGI